MKIKRDKYVISTTDFPLLFDDGSGNSVDDLDDAMIYDNLESASLNFNKFDDVDMFQILPISVTYEI